MVVQQIETERRRQNLQGVLDGNRSQEQRNKMGQFATPIGLSKDIMAYARTLFTDEKKIDFLDPCVGTGSFYSALIQEFPKNSLNRCCGFEIDPYYALPSKELWSDFNLDYEITDFTKRKPPISEDKKFDLLVCNPPYVRHHHITGDKSYLKKLVEESSNMSLSGLTGLYGYFIGLAHRWMKKDGIAGWLIPSEFMDVNYGRAIKKYLLEEVSLIHIHRFDPLNAQFSDALVSSSVVWFKNEKPTKNMKIRFSYGGTLNKPHNDKLISIDDLRNEKKWTRFPRFEVREKNKITDRLNDFFSIKRGIATGNNKFFILSKSEIISKKLPLSQFRPILPSPRHMPNTIVSSDSDGNPNLSQSLFVLDSELSLEAIEKDFPNLHNYLQEGITGGVNKGYLCNSKKIWYSQEKREQSKFYCTYIGRTNDDGKNPFRFILNNSRAIVTNSYLILYPKEKLKNAISRHPELLNRILDILNNISAESMIEEGRVYGGGMYKLEPKELANVKVSEIALLINNYSKREEDKQLLEA